MRQTYAAHEAVEVSVALCKVDEEGRLGISLVTLRNVSSRAMELEVQKHDYDFAAASVSVDGHAAPAEEGFQQSRKALNARYFKHRAVFTDVPLWTGAR